VTEICVLTVYFNLTCLYSTNNEWIWIWVTGSGFEKIPYLNERSGSACSKGKEDLLVWVPKWCLACGGQIWVLGTQLLDPVI